MGGGRAHSPQGHTPGPPSSAVVSFSEAEVRLLSPVARRLSVRPRTLRRGADTPASSQRVHAHRALPCPTGREQTPPMDLPGLKQDISGVLSQEYTQNVINLLRCQFPDNRVFGRDLQLPAAGGPESLHLRVEAERALPSGPATSQQHPACQMPPGPAHQLYLASRGQPPGQPLPTPATSYPHPGDRCHWPVQRGRVGGGCHPE